MTKHRSKEEWISEILKAAAEEIDENGYGAFTMESIVRRTQLSKGGVYRFYKNKQDVALALFSMCYEKALNINVEEALKWGLPPDETFFRLITRFNLPEAEARQSDRLWIRLIPEILSDERFRHARKELLDQIQEVFLDLAVKLAHRDNISLPEDFRGRFSDAIAMGIGLMEGFAVQSALGNSIDHLAVLTRRFVSGLAEDSLNFGKGKGGRHD